MDIKELQDKINQSFKVFGFTPFKERMEDIHTEFSHLSRWRDVNNLKEEVGDLLSSLIQLCNETGWDVSDVVENTLQKIERRTKQYQSLGRKTQVAILGGAFDPIHNDHIQLSKYILDNSGVIDEVWIMPAYGHMAGKRMASPEDRLEMCRLASEVDNRIKVFDYEIKNKLGGETYYFFKKLNEETKLNERYDFSMIIGLDNANSFDKWVNYKGLERMGKFIVVPRKGVKRKSGVDWYLKSPHIFMDDEDTGIIDISSTQIRNALKNDESTDKLLDPKVLAYIKEHNLYPTSVVESYKKFIKNL